MASLPEIPSWESAVLQLEESDKAKAGPGGILNLQATQLANRTSYLKEQLAAYNGLLKSGELPFVSKAAAQSAVTSGKIPEGALLSIRSDNPYFWVEEFKNVSGALVSTGKFLPGDLLIAPIVNTSVQDPDGTITGLSVTHEGQRFGVVQSFDNTKRLQYYEKKNGIAEKLIAMVSYDEFNKLNSEIPNLVRSSDIEDMIFIVTDKSGFIGFQAEKSGGFGTKDVYVSPGVLKAGSLLLSHGDDAFLTACDTNGFFVDIINNAMQVYSPRFLMQSGSYLEGTDEAIIRIADKNGFYFDVMDNNGNLAGGENGGAVDPESDYLKQQDSKNRSQVDAVSRRVVSGARFPADGYNHFIGQGQSLVMAEQGFAAVTKTEKYDNLMLGDSVRPSVVGANAFTPVGSNAFRPLKGVTQSDGGGRILNDSEVQALTRLALNQGEAPIVGAVNGFRRHFLDAHALPSDPSRLFVASVVGVSGQSIARLIADDVYFNRYRECVTKAHALALADGKTYSVSAIMFMQGEQDYALNTSKEEYKALEGTLRNKLNSVAREITGQKVDPFWFMYQTGFIYTPATNTFPFAANTLSVGMAQFEFSEENENCFMVGPNYQLPDKDGHLMNNGYRWMGCYFAKAMDRVINQRKPFKPLHPTDYKVIGNNIYVSFYVDQPPLQFQSPFRRGTRYSIPNKGFRVLDNVQNDSAGIGTEMTINAVEIVAPTIVRIECGRVPVGTVRVVYASKPATMQQYGQGMLTDSDTYIPDDVYEYDPQFTQWPEENIPELIGKPYPMQNWCIAFSQTFEAN